MTNANTPAADLQAQATAARAAADSFEKGLGYLMRHMDDGQDVDTLDRIWEQFQDHAKALEEKAEAAMVREEEEASAREFVKSALASLEDARKALEWASVIMTPEAGA